MTPVVAYVFLAAWIFSLAQILVGILVWRRSMYLKRIARTDQIRRHFAQARNGWVWLAIRGELSPENTTFHSLYALHTSVMRRTESYPELSESIWADFLDGEQHTVVHRALRLESATWDPAMRDLIRFTREGIIMIALEYLPFRHLTMRFLRLPDPAKLWGEPWAFNLWKSLHPALGKIREAEELLRPFAT